MFVSEHLQEQSSNQGAVTILASTWPQDKVFLDALQASWVSQYAEYIGKTRATALVKRLLDVGELHPDQEHLVYLAMIDAKPVGVSACRPLQGLTLITMLEVLDECRHQGIGRRMVADLQGRTEQRLLAHVSIHRPGVLRFYESQGFTRLPRARVNHFGHDLEFDVVVR